MSLHEVPFRSSALDHIIASYKGALTAVLLDQISNSPAAGSVQVPTVQLPCWLCAPACLRHTLAVLPDRVHCSRCCADRQNEKSTMWCRNCTICCRS